MGLEEFRNAAAATATLIASRKPGMHWFIDCDTDADGLCAAAVTGSALRTVGHRFTIRPSRDKGAASYRALFANDADGILLLDKGTSHIELLAENAELSGRPVVVVDHHNLPGPTPPGINLLNPRACGLDGSRDASAATTAALLALHIAGDDALGWGPTALAGAVGDWQHMGGWQGWNRELVDRCRAAGHLRPQAMVRLPGVTLAEALAHAHPPIAEFQDRPRDAARWLESVAIAPQAEVEELDDESRTRLVSGLTLLHLAAGNPHAAGQVVGPVDVHARLRTSLRQVFRIVDACGREGQASTGIAYLMGDAGAKADALGCFARYKSRLGDGVDALRETAPEKHRAVQVAWTESPDYTGMVAGAGMTHVVEDMARALCVAALRPDGQVQVSTRGTHEQVARGLDLGVACKAAADAVGSEGGGHPVAAGAVVAKDRFQDFIYRLDAALVAQGYMP